MSWGLSHDGHQLGRFEHTVLPPHQNDSHQMWLSLMGLPFLELWRSCLGDEAMGDRKV